MAAAVGRRCGSWPCSCCAMVVSGFTGSCAVVCVADDARKTLPRRSKMLPRFAPRGYVVSFSAAVIRSRAALPCTAMRARSLKARDHRRSQPGYLARPCTRRSHRTPSSSSSTSRAGRPPRTSSPQRKAPVSAIQPWALPSTGLTQPCTGPCGHDRRQQGASPLPIRHNPRASRAPLRERGRRRRCQTLRRGAADSAQGPTASRSGRLRMPTFAALCQPLDGTATAG